MQNQLTLFDKYLVIVLDDDATRRSPRLEQLPFNIHFISVLRKELFLPNYIVEIVTIEHVFHWHIIIEIDQWETMDHAFVIQPVLYVEQMQYHLY